MRIFLTIAVLMTAVSCGPHSRIEEGVDAYWFPEQILTLEDRRRESAVKLARIQDLLKRERLSGLLVGTVRNYSWLTAGGEIPVVFKNENECLPLFILDDGRKYFIASNGDASRMQEEDLKDMGYEVKEIPWYGETRDPGRLSEVVRELTDGRPFGSDNVYAGSVMLDDKIAGLRVPLTETEIRKYRWLGRRCAEAVDSVCRKIRPGMTERGIEALMSGALMRHAIRPAAILIGSDEHILKYRNPSRSDTKKVEKLAMVNICARRWGLTIAMTRFVHFGPLPEDLEKRFTAAARVNAGFWARTVPGASAAAILEGAIADYGEVGHPEEWRKHHQGGTIGYQERDWVVTPGSIRTVHADEAFAWNPTIQGAKIEDTILLAGETLEVLTEIPAWPVLESRALGRIYRSPSVLIR